MSRDPAPERKAHRVWTAVLASAACLAAGTWFVYRAYAPAPEPAPVAASPARAAPAPEPAAEPPVASTPSERRPAPVPAPDRRACRIRVTRAEDRGPIAGAGVSLRSGGATLVEG